MIGQTLDGRYRIVRSLAAGGFGHTFIAEDIKQFNKSCVVKQLKPSFSNPDALQVARRLFESEAQLLNRLGDHDQIPRLLAYFEAKQEFFLVQDFVDGHSLETEITVGKKLSEAYAIALLNSLLQPLVFIHRQNVIHRDIKPANLIRRYQDGQIVLIDFGAVKELAATKVNAQGKTRVGTIIGTPGYMSSEQGRGTPKLSSDIYAAGMIVVQALTGKLPPMGFGSADELEEDAQTAELLWRSHATVSPEFATIIDRMICYDFRQRYPSAVEVQTALKQLDNGTALPETQAFDNQTRIQAAPIEISQTSSRVKDILKKADPSPPKQPHWTKSIFRGLQRFIAISFLIMGLPIGVYTVVEMNNPSVPEDDRQNAFAALVVFALPLTSAGSWILWSLNRRIRKEKFDSDWLRQSFYQVLNESQGEVSILRFAQTTQLSGKDAQKYLEQRVKEFNGDRVRSPEGETLYRFKL